MQRFQNSGEVEAEFNPLLAFNPEEVRMFSFNERTIVLTIGNKFENIEFPSREQMQSAMWEWLEGSVTNDKPSPM